MKVLIVDNKNKDRGFSDMLKNHKEVKIQNTDFQALRFTNCKIIFKHDNFDHNLTNEQKTKIIHVEFSSGGNLKNEILDESDGYKFKAKIEFPEQINNVVSIIDKTEFGKEDLEMILNFDPKLEELLEPFQSVLPLDSEWKKHRSDTKEDLGQKRTELRIYIKTQ